MAKTKLSTKDRAELDEAIVTLRRALADALEQAREDDECIKHASAQSDAAAIKAAAERDGTRGGILLSRALGHRGGQ